MLCWKLMGARQLSKVMGKKSSLSLSQTFPRPGPSSCYFTHKKSWTRIWGTLLNLLVLGTPEVSGGGNSLHIPTDPSCTDGDCIPHIYLPFCATGGSDLYLCQLDEHTQLWTAILLSDASEYQSPDRTLHVSAAAKRSKTKRTLKKKTESNQMENEVVWAKPTFW